MKYQKKNRDKRTFKNNYKLSDELENQEWDGGETSEDPNETSLPKWHEEFLNTPAPIKQLTNEEIATLRNEASRVLTDETAVYHSNKEKRKLGSDQAWIKTVLQKGTASDKVAAHVLKIQESPVFNLSSITTLVNMVKLSKTDFSFVIDTLAELFITDLLPPDLKLRTFEKQPLDQLSDLSSGNAMTRRKRLAYWAFEDELKKLYMQLIQSLNIIARDSVEENKEKAVSVLYQLLSSHPEQEDVILKVLVNKLGDPSRKVASKVIYSLIQLLRVHEAMKQVVMDEVEHLLFRPNINTKAQYYAICFLSQFHFTINDDQVACNIMSIYFSFFKACIKKGDVSSRMLSSLLMGLNRAYPYAKKKSDVLTDHVNTLYKLANLATFNISIQCLSILFQVSDSSEDRFYNVLYRKLSDLQLGTSAHQAMFINLLYRALMKDSNVGRIRTFIKRILQLCGVMPVPLACGLLYLVSQLILKRNLQNKNILQPEAIDEKFAEEDDEEYYKDVDTGEVSSAEKQKDLDNSELKQEESEDDFIKQEVDSVLDESDVTEMNQENKNVETKKERKPCAAWYHTVFQKRKTGFDPLARNPSFAQGESAIYTELTLLTRHFHPTVALFASEILKDKVITYTGDPLVDFSLIRFIERFVFKNPKKVIPGTEVKGPDPVLAPRKYYTPTGSKALATNSKLYLEQNEKDVPIDELFLFKYLRQKQSLGYSVARKEKDDDDSDVDSVASEEFEEMLNNMTSEKEDIDFADDIGDSLNNKSGKKSKRKNKDEEDDDDDDDDIDDENEDDFDNEDEDEMVGDAKITDDLGSDNDESDFDLSDIDDSDAEVMDFDESEDEVDDDSSKNKSKRNKKGSKINVRKLKEDLSGLFAPAEEFAEMLEETGTSGYKTGTAHALSNKDKAATKQLDWEMKRHDWVKGHNKRKNNNNFKKGKRRKMK